MNTLPIAIEGEIFNLRYRISDVAINHLADDLDSLGLTITGYEDMDHALVLLARHGDFNVEVRVDRIRRCFDAVARSTDNLFLPMSGNWLTVMEYLREALAYSHDT